MEKLVARQAERERDQEEGADHADLVELAQLAPDAASGGHACGGRGLLRGRAHAGASRSIATVRPSSFVAMTNVSPTAGASA